MNRMLWGWLIAAGLLLARLGYLELHAAEMGAAEPASSQMTVMILLTGGLLVGLFGITGLVGLLGWVPRPGPK